MWRFLRFGVKSNNCNGNQTTFRIIGSTCANAECEDTNDEEGHCSSSNKENFPTYENLASRASKTYHNFLYQKKRFLHHSAIASNHEISLEKPVESPLKDISLKDYLKEKENILNNLKETRQKTTPLNNLNKKERDNFVELKNDDLVFGSLSENERKFEEEADEELEHPLKGTFKRRLTPQDYGQKMLKLCRDRKLQEALEVLDVEMKLQHIIPNSFCYNVLISACGKEGYCRKAFKLFHEMRSRAIKIEKHALTGLFNACANSPFATTEGLKSAEKLRHLIHDREIQVHPITYNAMIKAFGHGGDIKTAFEIADEMLDKSHNITDETIAFLLQACISDKENGFRHALMVWRRMRSLQLRPTIYSYNLLLRSVKDCDAGDPQLFYELLENKEIYSKKYKVTMPDHIKKIKTKIETSKALSDSGNERKDKAKIGPLNYVEQIKEDNEIVKVDLAENMELEVVSIPENSLTKKESTVKLPKLLSRNFTPGNVLGLLSLKEKSERLYLLGGVTGVLEAMMEDGVKPDVKTFTYILHCLPDNIKSEESLLRTMESLSLIPDLIFCNTLIHRRCLRKDMPAAKEVLELMYKHSVYMDHATFCCLAMACRSTYEMKTLLRDMERAGFTPNEYIMTCLVKASMLKNEFGFIIELLRKIRHLEIDPSERMLKTIELARTNARKFLIEKETEKSENVSSHDKRIQDETRLFLLEYNNWLKKTKVAPKDQPWDHYESEQYNSTKELVNASR